MNDMIIGVGTVVTVLIVVAIAFGVISIVSAGVAVYFGRGVLREIKKSREKMDDGGLDGFRR